MIKRLGRILTQILMQYNAGFDNFWFFKPSQFTVAFTIEGGARPHFWTMTPIFGMHFIFKGMGPLKKGNGKGTKIQLTILLSIIVGTFFALNLN